MDWVVLSIFKATTGWIPSFVRSPVHRFQVIDPGYAHDRSRARASLSDWRDYFLHVRGAWRRIAAPGRRTGVIAVFPQLALIVGVFKRLTFSKRPAIAWMFNFGHTREGIQGRVARFGYAAIDRFVVHSTHEIEVYSRWLRLPRERFVFVPLSVAEHPITETEESDVPFLLSMGTANRDYELLLKVMAEVPYRAVIVAGSHALAGLQVPPNVEVRTGLSEVACRELCQRARLSIVPIKDLETAAGQVTVVEGMMAGRPVIATRSVGTVDYIEQDVDGVLVPPGDAGSLRAAIDRLWNDADARAAMCVAARRSALDKFTFKAVALNLETMVDELATNDERPLKGPYRAA